MGLQRQIDGARRVNSNKDRMNADGNKADLVDLERATADKVDFKAA